MYICNCNGISERQVAAAIRAGAARWDEVHAHYRRAPRCGKCAGEIAARIADHGGRPGAPLAALAPAHPAAAR